MASGPAFSLVPISYNSSEAKGPSSPLRLTRVQAESVPLFDQDAVAVDALTQGSVMLYEKADGGGVQVWGRVNTHDWRPLNSYFGSSTASSVSTQSQEFWVAEKDIFGFESELAYTRHQTKVFSSPGEGKSPGILPPGAVLITTDYKKTSKDGWFKVEWVANRLDTFRAPLTLDPAGKGVASVLPKEPPDPSLNPTMKIFRGFIDSVFGFREGERPSPTPSSARTSGPQIPPGGGSSLPQDFGQASTNTTSQGGPSNNGAQEAPGTQGASDQSPTGWSPLIRTPPGFELPPPVRFVPFQEWANPDYQEAVKKNIGVVVPADRLNHGVKAIQIHHTTVPTFHDDDYSKPIEVREAMCRNMLNELLDYHLNKRKFNAMAYNFTYCPLTDTLYGGREVFGFDPAGVRRLNADTAAVAFIGQYENTDEGKKQADGIVNAVTPLIEKRLISIIKWMATEYRIPIGINPETGKTYTTVIRDFENSEEINGNPKFHTVVTLGGHRLYGELTRNHTDCPGDLDLIVNKVNSTPLIFPYYTGPWGSP